MKKRSLWRSLISLWQKNKFFVKHLFFIAETKGSMNSMELRGVEKAKIECVKKLFNDISSSKVRYHEVTNYDSMLNEINAMR